MKITQTKPLAGKKIAVFVEHKFIPEEMAAYRTAFSLYGAQVDFVSRLWYGDYKPNQVDFYSDVDPLDQQPWQSPEKITATLDITQINLDDYAAVIMSANYVSVRLRWSDNPEAADAKTLVRSAPTACFFAEAMKRHNLVKGALCHGLWILTPYPELLKSRKVTCHTVIMADILNCQADIVFEQNETGKVIPATVVVDQDLVTGYDKHAVLPFIDAVADSIIRLERN